MYDELFLVLQRHYHGPAEEALEWWASSIFRGMARVLGGKLMSLFSLLRSRVQAFGKVGIRSDFDDHIARLWSRREEGGVMREEGDFRCECSNGVAILAYRVDSEIAG